MPQYTKNYITQVIVRADFAPDTVPLVEPGEGVLSSVDELPVKTRRNRSRSEIRVQKTPQGPVKNTRTISFTEFNFLSEDQTRHIALSSEYVLHAVRGYEGYAPVRSQFLSVFDALADEFPSLRIKRLGMRYINEIKLPEADAGPGLGADFWEQYVNPLLVGGLRFAANLESLARHMCTTELNYGTDRATLRYGVFNGDYPKPNRKREFVLDVDTYCLADVPTGQVAAKLDDYHAAACSVFEAAVTDKLRARMSGEGGHG